MNDVQSKSQSSADSAESTGSSPQSSSLLDSEYELASATKAGGKKRAAAGQSVKAAAEIRLTDKRWPMNNLGGDGTYIINPAISATLGAGEHDIENPTVFLGSNSLGSHVQLKVEDSQVKREASTGGHSQFRFLARYQLKNRNTWKTPNMSFGMKAANTLEVGGKGNASGEAQENTLVQGVKVQGGVEGNISEKLHSEAEAAVKEFSLGATDEYFDHWHQIEMVVASSGYAVSAVTESDGRGTVNKEVEAERHTWTEQVVTKGGSVSKVHKDGQKDKKQMRLLK